MIAKERSTISPLPSPLAGVWRAVVMGKGGAGKTTLAALLSLRTAQGGEEVLVIDADSQATLAYCLGVPTQSARSIVPLSRDIHYLNEKIGVRNTATDKATSDIEPNVDDVFERFAIKVRDRLHLLVTGHADPPVSGCLCPEHALITGIFRYLIRRNREVIILDSGDGIPPPEGEISAGFMYALIVAEPTFGSLRIAELATALSLDLGIPHLYLVVNKIRTERDVSRVKEFATGLACYEQVFSLPYDEKVRQADPDVSGLLGKKTPFMGEIDKIYRTLKGYSPVMLSM
ncbi:MAG: AAA family ATPase [Methanomicrobiales archaeon]|nr:AAA family ATPase [Methanomicrobiales archaeon]